MKLKTLSPDNPLSKLPSSSSFQWSTYQTALRKADHQAAEVDIDSPLSSAPPSPAIEKEKEKKPKGKCGECSGSLGKAEAKGGGHKASCSKQKLSLPGDSRKRALSDTSESGPLAKKKKSAATVGDSEAEGEGGAEGKKDKGKGKDGEDGKKAKKSKEGMGKGSKKMKKGGPVDVNIQCGVLIPPNSIPCARSLTCKTHSMGAKRSVPGRSAPYDVLLFEWQKKHNPNFGDRKIVTPRVGPGIEPGGAKKRKKDPAAVNNSNTNGHHTNYHSSANPSTDPRLLGEIDEDFLPSPPPARRADGENKAEGEEDSDDELELMSRGVQAANGGRALVDEAMGSAWMGRRWRFGRWGVREGFREAFGVAMGAGGAGAGAGITVGEEG